RWINRQSFRLALGILPSGASRLVARPALFLATRSTRRGTPSRTKIVPPAPGGLPDAVSDALVCHQLHRPNIDDFRSGWVGLLGIGLSALSKSKSGLRDDRLRIDHRGRRFDLHAFRRNRG